MMHGWGMGWGGMFLGPLFMIAWLAILVAVIVLVVRWLGGGAFGVSPRARTSREILDERFARGEIDHEEYEKRRKALSS
jgi:putative membrane protein